MLEGKSYNKIILELNTKLLKIESWLVANRLTLDVSKTHYMIFHRYRIKTVDHDLILNGNVVKRATATKFLGIIVDDQLSGGNMLIILKLEFLNPSKLFIKLEIMLTDIL